MSEGRPTQPTNLIRDPDWGTVSALTFPLSTLVALLAGKAGEQTGGQDLLELFSECLVQPGVQEGVVHRGAHGDHVSQEKGQKSEYWVMMFIRGLIGRMRLGDCDAIGGWNETLWCEWWMEWIPVMWMVNGMNTCYVNDEWNEYLWCEWWMEWIPVMWMEDAIKVTGRDRLKQQIPNVLLADQLIT